MAIETNRYDDLSSILGLSNEEIATRLAELEEFEVRTTPSDELRAEPYDWYFQNSDEDEEDPETNNSHAYLAGEFKVVKQVLIKKQGIPGQRMFTRMRHKHSAEEEGEEAADRYEKDQLPPLERIKAPLISIEDVGVWRGYYGRPVPEIMPEDVGQFEDRDIERTYSRRNTPIDLPQPLPDKYFGSKDDWDGYQKDWKPGVIYHGYKGADEGEVTW